MSYKWGWVEVEERMSWGWAELRRGWGEDELRMSWGLSCGLAWGLPCGITCSITWSELFFCGTSDFSSCLSNKGGGTAILLSFGLTTSTESFNSFQKSFDWSSRRKGSSLLKARGSSVYW